MSTVPVAKLTGLQQTTQNLRNVCVLAHVDHGKTTLTDSLLSTNGIISSRLAGKVRYLDSRQDEQERGITMESSGVSLYFKVLNKIDTTHNSEQSTSPTQTDNTSGYEVSEYLVNLIDSPGHIDFSSEVSSASRLTDGALVLVDVVEGVCTQTISVLRQAWLEKVQTVLVINKLDRLIIELMMTPAEAYIHIQHLIEQVNAVLAGFWESDRMAASDKKIKKSKKSAKRLSTEAGTLASLGKMSISTSDWHLEEEDDSHVYFDPAKGNVIFSSATDGWAFRVNEFAAFASEKMALGNPEKLKQVIWGDFYLDPKNKKRVLNRKQFNKLYRSGNSSAYPNTQPLFVQLCLASVWKVYEATILSPDQDQIDKIIASIGSKISPKDRKVKDPKLLASLVMRSWLPLAQTCMLAIIDKLPSPNQAQPIRIPMLVRGKYNFKSGSVFDSLLRCDRNSPPVAYVSKMLAVQRSNVPEFMFKSDRLKLTAEEMRARGREMSTKAPEENKSTADNYHPEPSNQAKIPNTDEKDTDVSPCEKDDEILIGFARLYAGVLRKGDSVVCLNPRYKPKKPSASNYKTAKVLGLYIFMGSELLSVDRVYPGCIFGIRGLESGISSSGTLSTDLKDCPNLSSLHFESAPIVRVAVEPLDPTEINKLVSGLKILCDSDSSVRVDHTSSGEYVLVTAGELHLERCLTDLRERFAKCEINVSEPRVPFKETIVRAPGRPNVLDVLNGPNYGISHNQMRTVQRNNSSSINDEHIGSPALKSKDVLSGIIPGGISEERGFIVASTPNKFATVYLSVQPMNEDAISYLTKNKSKLSIFSGKTEVDEPLRNSSTLLSEAVDFALSSSAQGSNDTNNITLEPESLGVSPERLDDFSSTFSEELSPSLESHINTNSGFNSDNFSDSDGSSSDNNNSDIEYDLSLQPGQVEIDVRSTETLDNTTDDLSVKTNKYASKWDTQRSIILSRIKSHLMKDKSWERRSTDFDSNKIWTFGPHHNGANVLFSKANTSISLLGEQIKLFGFSDFRGSQVDREARQSLGETRVSSSSLAAANLQEILQNSKIQLNLGALVKDIEQSVESAFQLATRSGPLCSEPVVGLACTLYHIELNVNKDEDPLVLKSVLSTLYGQLISTTRDAIREAMLMWSPRLLLAMYDCEIQASSDVLGKMYGVISKRKGKIISEELLEGTPYFRVKATIPVVESFGFTDEMRKRTSGGAQPLLVFKGFETLDVDPFWVPTTEEELEDLGEKADHENVARLYMDAVRSRKGLFVERKIVEFAEKQRTLKR